MANFSLSGTTKLRQQDNSKTPLAAKVVAVQNNNGTFQVVGQADSSPADGSYTLAGTLTGSDGVYLLAFEDFGQPFSTGLSVSVGDIIRPTTFGGYLYDVTVAGTLPATEPTWWTDGSQQVGTATLKARNYVQPVADGPLFPEITDTVSIKFVIDKTQVSGTLTDYPVYLDLSLIADADFWSKITSSGGDIRIYKSDGTTELPRDIIFVDTALKVGAVRAKYTGQLDNSEDHALLIKVNGVSSDYAVTDVYGRNSVWSNGFAGVWSFDSLSAPDRTGQRPNLVSHNLSSSSIISGKFNKAVQFNGSNQYMYAPLTASVNLESNDFMISTWSRIDAQSNTYPSIISKRIDYSNMSFDVIVLSGKITFDVMYTTNKHFSNSGWTVLSGWHQICLIKENNQIRLIVDGVSIGTPVDATGKTLSNTPQDILFGLLETSGSEYFKGSINEAYVAISTVGGGQNWITTEYKNQSSPSTFFKSVTRV